MSMRLLNYDNIIDNKCSLCYNISKDNKENIFMKSILCLAVTTIISVSITSNVAASTVAVPIEEKGLMQSTSSISKTDEKINLADSIKQAYSDILVSYTQGNYNTQEQYPTYCIYDIDKNGTPELMIKFGTCEADYKYRFYGYENGNAKYLYTTSAGHTCLYSYPSANGIVLYFSNQACEIKLLTLNNGIVQSTILHSSGYNEDYDYNTIVPNSQPLEYNNNYTYNYVNDFSALNIYFIHNNVMATYVSSLNSTEKTNSVVSFENILSEVEQIKSYISEGLYLEAINMCSNVEKNHHISPSDQSIINSLRESAQDKYNEFAENMLFNTLSDIAKQIQNYYYQGLYLEGAQLANDTLHKYTLSEIWEEVFKHFSSSCESMYRNYLLKQQRYTYRIPGWGMNIVYRGDMYPKMDNDVLTFFDENNSSYFMCIDSNKIGDSMYTNYQYKKIKGPKQYVDEQISDIKRIYSTGYFEYGERFETISANYTTVSGFSAYQVVYRHTIYKNRYWTEGQHLIGKMICFQYGNWIYSIWCEESSYNWTNDFWNAMEVVINGISFN